MQLSQAQLTIPTEQNQCTIFESYLHHRLTGVTPFTFVDVKYNSTHHLNSLWHNPLSRPLLFQWLRDQRWPVIHLVRQNILECYVSYERACRSESWESNEPRYFDTIEIQPARMLNELRRRRMEIDTVRGWLKGCNYREFYYESLIDRKGLFSRSVARQVYRFLDIESEDLPVQPATVKTGRSVEQSVSNYRDEIVPSLIRGGFENLIDLPRAA
jgi:hypothetical protein